MVKTKKSDKDTIVELKDQLNHSHDINRKMRFEWESLSRYCIELQKQLNESLLKKNGETGNNSESRIYIKEINITRAKE
jgi:hypothetical protein